MKKLLAVQFIACLLISCGHDQEKSRSKFYPLTDERSDDVIFPITNPKKSRADRTDPFEGFLSEADTYAYFKSISPMDTMWRYKRTMPTFNTEKNYSYTEGYLLYPESKQIGFVTLICDPWNYGFCNKVLEYPHPNTVRISEAISGVPEKYDGYRIVRETKDNEAIDYLFKFDEEGHPLLKDGPILHLTNPCITIPPASKEMAIQCLTEHERTNYRFDYRN